MRDPDGIEYRRQPCDLLANRESCGIEAQSNIAQ
jgi:hypothetical protein